MNAQTYMRLIAAVAGLATATTACSSNVPNRAGGSVDAQVSAVLTLAVGNDGAPTQLTDWINQVHDLSHGSIRIEVKQAWRLGETDYEAQTVHDVEQAKVDMAEVGARAMDRVGVTSFQALLAPMLVDSYNLQASVFQAGIPTQMLDSVPAAGVVGVAVLPGPMRKVMGIAKPFLTPADFVGARIADQDSALTQMTLQTLGATAVPEPSGAKLHGVDGYEQQLESIAGNRYDTIAKYTTANLNLWPRPLLIIMGKAAWAKLSGTQRDILRKAADTALQPAIDASRQEEQQALPVLCKNAMTLPTALPRQLAELRTALDPVYASLRRDASTNKWLDQIQALKDQLHADPESVSCAGFGEASQKAAPIDGTYSRRSGVADIVAACHATPPPGTPAHTTLEVVFDHGNLTQYQQTNGGTRDIGWRGTYQVFRDTLELTEAGTTAPMTLTWSLNGSTLTLSNLRNEYNCLDAAVWAHAWTKLK
ncbi:MAG TPA: TRAP transporter substrate-binding protein DctP [Mycobacterium sp.]|nr:TRAP transporter substrate-binding protein DctP [Mycobacterium sp.]